MASMSGFRSGPASAGIGDVDDFERSDRLQPSIELHHHSAAADREVVESGATGRKRDSGIGDAKIELQKSTTPVRADRARARNPDVMPSARESFRRCET